MRSESGMVFFVSPQHRFGSHRDLVECRNRIRPETTALVELLEEGNRTAERTRPLVLQPCEDISDISALNLGTPQQPISRLVCHRISFGSSRPPERAHTES